MAKLMGSSWNFPAMQLPCNFPVTSLQFIFTQAMKDPSSSSNTVYEGRGIYIEAGKIYGFTRDGAATWRPYDLGAVVPNTWYHVALVQDGSKLLGYVNGVQSSQTPLTFTGYITTYRELTAVIAVFVSLKVPVGVVSMSPSAPPHMPQANGENHFEQHLFHDGWPRGLDIHPDCLQALGLQVTDSRIIRMAGCL